MDIITHITTTCINDVLPVEILEMILLMCTGYESVARYCCRWWYMIIVKRLPQYYVIRLNSVACSVQLLKWALAEGMIWSNFSCLSIAKYGTADVLKYALDNGCRWDIAVTEYAARYGKLCMLRYTKAAGYPMSRYITARAAENGHLGVIEWAYENGCEWDAAGIINAAILYEHTHVINYMVSMGYVSGGKICEDAAIAGKLSVIKYAHSMGYPMGKKVYNYAVFYDRFDLVKYLHDIGCPWNENTSLIAAMSGNTYIFEWLHANGRPHDPEVPGKIMK